MGDQRQNLDEVELDDVWFILLYNFSRVHQLIDGDRCPNSCVKRDLGSLKYHGYELFQDFWLEEY